jgi:hypothetical protein
MPTKQYTIEPEKVQYLHTTYSPAQKASKWLLRLRKRLIPNPEVLLASWTKKYSDKEKMSKEDFAKIIGKSIPADAELANNPAPSLSEIGFLGRMIKGSFNGFSEASFTKELDKYYFKKFSSLSQEEKLQKYKDLENQINEFALG